MHKIVIVGLGNPGERYLKTPHNIGWMVVDALEQHLKTDFDITESVKKLGKYLSLKIKNKNLVIVKPYTFMNNSGQAIDSLKHEKIVIFHDDTNLELGKIRYKTSPYKGSHNGILSIQNYTNNFECIRIGVGMKNDTSRVSYVLSCFNEQKMHIVNIVLNCIKNNIFYIVNENFDKFCSLVCSEIKNEMRNYRNS